MVLTLLPTLSAHAQTWDAKQQFSTTQNPGGPWSYGWSTALGGAVTLYPNYTVIPPSECQQWEDDSIIQNECPHVTYYPGTTQYSYLPPQSMLMQAGPENQFSNCIWTAPTSGTYNIQASFTALDIGAPHGYLLINGTDAGDSILPYQIQKNFNIPSVVLAAGDTVQVVAGVGSDNAYFNDESEFTFTITATNAPPPPPPPVATYDAKADFSTSRNPGGPWSYGWSTALAGHVTLYPNFTVIPPSECQQWEDDSIIQNECPHVTYYPGLVPYSYLPPQSLCIQAGPENQFSHCTWTAPTSGTYNIAASFTALDIGNPHGYLLKNRQIMGDSLLPLGVEKDFAFNSVVLNAGDTIDLVAGVGPDDAYFNDESNFTFAVDVVDTGTGSQPSNGVVVPGRYSGIFQPSAGSGVAGGSLTLNVNRHLAFSGVLDWDGTRLPIAGYFSKTGTYSHIFRVPGRSMIDVVLSFDASGNLGGSVTQNGVSYTLLTAPDSIQGPAAGDYTFAIIPGAPASGTPAGNGLGYMYVSPAGMVTLIGTLADGKPLSAAIPVTSGTLVNLYADPYGNPGSGISGSLTFADIPGVSDCSGTLSWTREPDTSASYYHGGFSTSVTFTATAVNPLITGLSGDTVSVAASGADLTVTKSYSVTLHGGVGILPYIGSAPGITLSISPLLSDYFSGSVLDSTTGKWVPYSGFLQPKSRTGAGLFFSSGESGAVDISY